MNNNTQAVLQINSETAKELEGYVSIGSDLQYVMKVTYKAIQFLAGDEDDFTQQTYLTAALVAYARPFKDGVRGARKLNLVASEIYSGMEGAEDFHDYLINQRDKLVAHSVNPFENVHVGIVLDQKGRPGEIGLLNGRLVSFTSVDYKQFNQLTKIALEATNEKILNAQGVLLKEAKVYTDEQIKRLKPVQFVAPSSNEAKKSRRSKI